MTLQTRFENLKSEFNLRETDFYFLELIPLIEMIWADGINQEGELKILHYCIIEHIASLDHVNPSANISVNDANSFLERFAYQKPDKKLLEALMNLFLSKKTSNRTTILDYCLDIAAACAIRYPFEFEERVVAEEKQLLKKLFQQLQVSPDQIFGYIKG